MEFHSEYDRMKKEADAIFEKFIKSMKIAKKHFEKMNTELDALEQDIKKLKIK